MFKFEIRDIIDRSSSLSVYKKGLEYYKKNKVENIIIDRENEMISAFVWGEKDYKVEIYFDEENITDASCECEDFSTWKGFCKHIVAVSLCVKMNNGSNFISSTKKSISVDKILDYYIDSEIQKTSEKEIVDAEYFLDIDTYSKHVTLSIKIGNKQSYVLKNPEDFFDSINYSLEFVFGKKFVFDPRSHYFSDKDWKVLKIVKNIIEDQKSYNSVFSVGSYSHHKYSLIKGKEITLSSRNLKSLLKILDNDFINIKIDGKLEIADIICKNIDFPFEISKNKTNFELKLNALENIKSLTEDFQVIYKEQKIYLISKDQRDDLKPLFFIASEESANILIEKESLGMFMSYLYPSIKKTCDVSVSKDIEDKVYSKNCNAKLYLDIDGDSIRANLKYEYGKYVYDSFNGLESEKPEDLIVIRDMKLENRIMNIIEESVMRVSKYGYHIDDEEEIFHFVKTGLPKLKDLVTVYYSDDFEKVSIKDDSSISFSTSLNENMNYFSFKFSVDNIDTSELSSIISALREKKMYYRLKDGSFLSLNSPELNSFIRVMDGLYIDDEDFVNGEVLIPNNRAFYLNDAIESMGAEHFKRNLLFKELILRIRSPEDETYEVPENVKNILRSYQVTGFNWLKTLSKYNFGGILADDMGLGKTVQVLSYIKSELKNNPDKKTLIVAPTSLVYNWLNEINKFLPSLKVLIINGTKKIRDDKLADIKDYNIVITSYALARNDIESYQKLNIDIMIIDEAQHIKNALSKTSRAIKTINASTKFALTGTPIENSILELWSIFDFILPGYLYTLGRFKTVFDKPVKEGDSNALNTLKKMINPFILRRLKVDVLKELPEKIENKIIVELNKDQKEIYMGYLEKVKGELEMSYKEEGFNRSRIKILAALTRLRQICCDPSIFLENYTGSSSKLELLEELLEELMEGKHRVLIFSQFTSMLKNIKLLLDRKDISYFYLDGSTKALKRIEMVDEFNEGDKKVFLISLKAGGTGLNLTGADTVIHFDPWWNPAVEDQATDRAYRIGQTKTVHVIKIVTKGTIEEKIYALQELKKQIVEKVIQPGETLITKMTEDDIRSLFE